ncbi:hypothetical protein PENTCL1PPCAC_30108, partial [Pristionchus entomophagus]
MPPVAHDEEPDEKAKAERRMLECWTPPSFIQIQVAANKSDSIEIASVASTVAGESSRSDDSGDFGPSFSADFSVPATTLGSQEWLLIEKDDDTLSIKITTNEALKRREPSPDIIFLECTPHQTASSSVPLTPFQHAARYRERMARKLETAKRREAASKHHNPGDLHSGSAAAKCALIPVSSTAGESIGSSEVARASGSLPSAPQSALMSSSGANEDDGPALGPMLMLSYLQSYNKKETCSSQPGLSPSKVRSKRKKLIATGSEPHPKQSRMPHSSKSEAVIRRRKRPRVSSIETVGGNAIYCNNVGEELSESRDDENVNGQIVVEEFFHIDQIDDEEHGMNATTNSANTNELAHPIAIDND